jgi:hypothetical protein
VIGRELASRGECGEEQRETRSRGGDVALLFLRWPYPVHSTMQASQRKLTHCMCLHITSNAYSEPRRYAVLSLPLGHHAGLRERVTKFTSALLNSPRRIPGLHETIVMKPHRMRFNLGVMPLDDGTDVSGDDGAGGSPRTLDDARALLAALRPRLLKIISSPSYGTSTPGKLRAPLTQMSISNAVKGDPRQAHALYLGLPEGAELRILSAVASAYLYFPLARAARFMLTGQTRRAGHSLRQASFKRINDSGYVNYIMVLPRSSLSSPFASRLPHCC